MIWFLRVKCRHVAIKEGDSINTNSDFTRKDVDLTNNYWVSAWFSISQSGGKLVGSMGALNHQIWGVDYEAPKLGQQWAKVSWRGWNGWRQARKLRISQQRGHIWVNARFSHLTVCNRIQQSWAKENFSSNQWVTRLKSGWEMKQWTSS